MNDPPFIERKLLMRVALHAAFIVISYFLPVWNVMNGGFTSALYVMLGIALYVSIGYYLLQVAVLKIIAAMVVELSVAAALLFAVGGLVGAKSITGNAKSFDGLIAFIWFAFIIVPVWHIVFMEIVYVIRKRKAVGQNQSSAIPFTEGSSNK